MSKLTTEQAESILSVLQRTEPDAELRSDYSGRGMYGRTCLGFVVRNPQIIGAAVAIGLACTDIDPVEMMSHAARDSMGRDFIIYFPEITVSSSEAS